MQVICYDYTLWLKTLVKKKEHRHLTGCPVACALDLIGDHWTLLIIRDLMFRNRHEYKDMIGSEEAISSNILSNRLKKLESAEIISSIPHPKSGKRKLYYLTPKGKDLIYLMVDIVRWSDKHLGNIVHIPTEKKQVLANNPKLMIESILRELQEWEQQHGVPN